MTSIASPRAQVFFIANLDDNGSDLSQEVIDIVRRYYYVNGVISYGSLYSMKMKKQITEKDLNILEDILTETYISIDSDEERCGHCGMSFNTTIFDKQDCPHCGQKVLPCKTCGKIYDCNDCPFIKATVVHMNQLEKDWKLVESHIIEHRVFID